MLCARPGRFPTTHQSGPPWKAPTGDSQKVSRWAGSKHVCAEISRTTDPTANVQLQTRKDTTRKRAPPSLPSPQGHHQKPLHGKAPSHYVCKKISHHSGRLPPSPAPRPSPPTRVTVEASGRFPAAEDVQFAQPVAQRKGSAMQERQRACVRACVYLCGGGREGSSSSPSFPPTRTGAGLPHTSKPNAPHKSYKEGLSLPQQRHGLVAKGGHAFSPHQVGLHHENGKSRDARIARRSGAHDSPLLLAGGSSASPPMPRSEQRQTQTPYGARASVAPPAVPPEAGASSRQPMRGPPQSAYTPEAPAATPQWE
jgi:hypothetical protein